MSLARTPTLAFVTDWLDSAYQEVILRGALAAARDRNVNLICFKGGLPGLPASSETNPVFGLVRPESVDGVIITATMLLNTPEAERDAFCAALRPLPICSIGTSLPGESAVVVDNDQGLAAAVRHLIMEHGYRRIGFIRGPATNAEAEQRLKIFHATLAEHELTADERLIFPGDFNMEAGAEAARMLFEERRLSSDDVDAIVAANDGMAISFIEALDARGVRVPDAIAVVGFDDVPDARYCRAPLTTVRQPLYEQGREATRLTVARMQGGAGQTITMPTELVVRRSCGCLSGMNRMSFQTAKLAASGFRFDVALIERRQIVLAELSRAARGALGMLGSGWEARLLTALTEELSERAPDRFRGVVDDMLRRAVDGGADAAAFHDVVSVLWQKLIPCTVSDPDLRTNLESMLDEARLLTAAAVQRIQGADRVRLRDWTAGVVEAAAAVSMSFSLERLAAVVEASFPRIGIPRVQLALRDGVRPDQLISVLSFANGRVELEHVPLRPQDFLRRMFPPTGGYGMYVSALHFESELLGVVAMELGAPGVFVYEGLRGSFSAALKGMRLREELGLATELARIDTTL